jgi:hypothetical protein
LDTRQLAGAPIFAAAWSPDGTHLAYGGSDGTLETQCTYTAPTQPPTLTVVAGDVAGLIAAINSANANGGNPDIIQLTESTYTLTTSNNTNSGGNGLPRITTDITLRGDCSILSDPPIWSEREFRREATTPHGEVPR